MKHGFYQFYKIYEADRYRLDFGTIYYVASPATPGLNAYVRQHAAAIAKRINEPGDQWLECRIEYLDIVNPLFATGVHAQFYGALIPTIKHPDGYPFLGASLVGCCNEQLVHEAFERYFRSLLNLLDQILDTGGCNCSPQVDLRPESSPIEFMIGPSDSDDDVRFSIKRARSRASGDERPVRTQLSRLQVTLYNAPIVLPDYDAKLCFTAQVKALYVLFLLHPEGIRMKDMGDYKEEFKRLYFRFSNRSDTDKLRDSIDRLFDLWTPNAMNVKKSQCHAELRRAIPEDDLRAHYEIQVNRGGPHTILLNRELVTFPDGFTLDIKH